MQLVQRVEFRRITLRALYEQALVRASPLLRGRTLMQTFRRTLPRRASRSLHRLNNLTASHEKGYASHSRILAGSDAVGIVPN